MSDYKQTGKKAEATAPEMEGPEAAVTTTTTTQTTTTTTQTTTPDAQPVQTTTTQSQVQSQPVSLSEPTQAWGSNMGRPAADAFPAIKGEVVYNTAEGKRSVLKGQAPS